MAAQNRNTFGLTESFCYPGRLYGFGDAAGGVGVLMFLVMPSPSQMYLPKKIKNSVKPFEMNNKSPVLTCNEASFNQGYSVAAARKLEIDARQRCSLAIELRRQNGWSRWSAADL